MPDPGSAEIFFSYSRTDSELVLKIAQALRRDGHRVWVDQLDIAKGARWDDEIEKALQSSVCLLVILSPAAVASQNVMDEVSFALGEGKKVIPVRVKDCVVPFRLRRLQFVDFTDGYSGGYRELSAALGTHASLPRHENSSEGAPRSSAAAVKTAAAVLAGIIATAGYIGIFHPISPNKITSQPTVVAPVQGETILALSLRPEERTLPATNVPVTAEPLRDGSAMVPTPTPLPASAPMISSVAPDPIARTARIGTDQELREFVRAFLAAQSRPPDDDLPTFYADQVDYFDHRGVDKSFILKDKKAYKRRWPEVDNELSSSIKVEHSPADGAAMLSYTIRYAVRSPTRAEMKSGIASDELRVRLLDGRLKIVGQRQRIISAQN